MPTEFSVGLFLSINRLIHTLLIDDDKNATHKEHFIKLWMCIVCCYIDPLWQVKILKRFEPCPYNDGSHPIDTVDEILSAIPFF